MAPLHPRVCARLERQRVALVARELELGRRLAGNEKRVRDRALKQLARWLRARSRTPVGFTEFDFERLWNGLFYCVWMSDKPLVQEELCESISKLFDCFEEDVATSALFFECFLKVIAKNWFGIDHHRLDKFLMLVRRVVRGALNSVKNSGWSVEAVESLESCLAGVGRIFSSDPSNEARMALGLQLHVIDCWMEEIAKVSEGDISTDSVTRLLKPFAVYLCYGTDNRVCSSIVKNVFTYLINQTDIGIDYQEKTREWFKAGCPGGDIDMMQKIELDDDDGYIEDEQNEKKKTALDPRAGHIDTVLPQLPVDGESVVLMLQSFLSSPEIRTTNIKRFKYLIKKFESLAGGSYPFKVKKVILPTDSKFKMPQIDSAAKDLMKFEKDVEDKMEDVEFRGLNKQSKRRMLAKLKKKEMKNNSDVTPTPLSEKPNYEEAVKNKNKKQRTIGNNKIEKIGKKINGITKKKCLKKSKMLLKDKNHMDSLSNCENQTDMKVPLLKSNVEKRQSNVLVSNSSKKKIFKSNKNVTKTPLKKVNIALSQNTMHSVLDYVKSVKQSPNIPFDSKKQPVKTSLKPNLIPSPLNPFYKKKIKTKF